MHKKEQSDYHNLARSKQTKWTGEKLPQSTTESTTWECLQCGRPLQKSYHKMRTGKNPCRCHSDSIKTPDDYRDLARMLSVKYSQDFWFQNQDYPQNTYEKVIWTVNGVKFTESYHNLAYYNSLPEHIRSLINMENIDE